MPSTASVAHDIERILFEKGIVPDPIKVGKIMILAQANHILHNKKTLFENDVVIGAHGPHIMNLPNHVKEDVKETLGLKLESKGPDAQTIRYTIERYGHMTTEQLCDHLTQPDSQWAKLKDNIGAKIIPNAHLALDALLQPVKN